MTNVVSQVERISGTMQSTNSGQGPSMASTELSFQHNLGSGRQFDTYDAETQSGHGSPMAVGTPVRTCRNDLFQTSFQFMADEPSLKSEFHQLPTDPAHLLALLILATSAVHHQWHKNMHSNRNTAQTLQSRNSRRSEISQYTYTI